MTAAPTISAKAKERPILFSAPMVKAILAGTKSQTRRIANVTAKGVLSPYQRKLQFEFNADKAFAGDLSWLGVIGGDADCVKEQQKYQQLNVPIRHPEDANIDWPDCGCNRIYCPYGQPGDRLWVKETWRIIARLGTEYAVSYRATEDDSATAIDVGWEGPTPKLDAKIHEDKWTPSIFMPRWASRLTLEIVAVRVERLQEISEEDAFAEGIFAYLSIYNQRLFTDTQNDIRAGEDTAVKAYRRLWQSINGPGSWDANPWVWCISFRRIAP